MTVPISLLLMILLAQTACTFAQPTTSHHHTRSSLILHRQNDLNVSLVPPSQDPFYKVPSNISSYALGAIIRERKVPDTSRVFGADAGDTYQLFYRTKSVGMKPDATVTTVISPLKPAKGNSKIVAIASAQDSPAIDCALSWTLYPNSVSKEKSSGLDGLTDTLKAALYQGYYVTLPDQEGSKAGWGAYSEGQAMLDGVRAIMNHRATIPDSKGAQVALAGYSGGGHGAAWAGQLASTYGKGLPIVALAAGGIPVDPAASVSYLDSKFGAGLAFSGLAGLANVYPKYNNYMLNNLKPNGSDAFFAVRNGSHCLAQSAKAYAYKSIFGSIKDPNFLNSPMSRKITDENYLGKNQEPITDFPVYQVHSQIDDVVIHNPALDYFHSQCTKGAKFIFTNPASGKHFLTGTKSVPSFIYFIKAAF